MTVSSADLVSGSAIVAMVAPGGLSVDVAFNASANPEISHPVRGYRVGKQRCRDSRSVARAMSLSDFTQRIQHVSENEQTLPRRNNRLWLAISEENCWLMRSQLCPTGPYFLRLKQVWPGLDILLIGRTRKLAADGRFQA